jgi:hypothetical protein
MPQPSRPARPWAVFLIPLALVGTGLLARAAAARAFHGFTAYRSPFVFPPAAQQPGPALTRRVVLVLMDGLGAAPSRAMPYLNELRARGAAYECGIGLPSLSMPARAVIATGAWQEVNGQTTNYGAHALGLEHLFQLARARGLDTALASGPKTQALFAPHVARRSEYPETPETAPLATFEAALRRETAASRALVEPVAAGYVHVELNLADEAGHGWGATSPEYARAVAEVDAAVREVTARVDLEQDTLVVTADHGHVAVGGHGGPEPDVMRVPLVLAGRGVRAGVSGTCAQVDVAPTGSVQLGLPLPAGSQGAPLLDALALDGVGRAQALRNAVTQREAFVRAYEGRLRAFDTPAVAEAGTVVPVQMITGAADEAALKQRLATLAEAEARAKQRRLSQEAIRRWPLAGLVALAPLLLVGALVRARVVSGRELARAAAFALGGVAAYHLLVPASGLGYSLTAVNKDEWLQPFFLRDMVLGALCCAAAAAALCVFARRRGEGLLALCRQAWLCAAVFCAVLLLEVAAIYTRHDLVPRWTLPDQWWGMAFYLDALALMAAASCAPLLAAVAALARLVPVRAAGAAG